MQPITLKKHIQDNRQNINALNIYVFCICVLLPFIFWNRLQDVDNTPKLLALSLFLSAFSVYFFLAKRKTDWGILKQYFKHPVYITCLLFLLLNFLSLNNALNYTDGLFTCLNYVLAFVHLNFMLLLLHSSKNPVGTVAFGITCTAFVLLCIGIFQIITTYLNLPPTKTFQFNYFIGSSVGNKNTFAECLLICFPFSIISFLNFKGAKKYFAFTVLISSGVLLVLLQTFSVWLSFGMAIVALLGTLFFSHDFRKLLLGENKFGFLFKPATIIVSVLLLIITVSFFAYSNTFQITDKINQVIQVFNPENNADANANINSITERKFMWGASLLMFKQNMLTGIGLSNWKIYFPEFNTSHSMLFSSGLVKFTYPHNDYLLAAAENGIAGLLLFIALFVVPVFVLISAIKGDKNTKEKINLLLILVSILFTASVCFFGYTMQRMMCVCLFFTILSLVLILTKHKQPTISANGKNYFFVFNVFVFLLSVYAANASLSRLNSEYYLGRTIIQQNAKNYARMLNESEKINTDYFKIDALTTPVEWYKATALFINGNIDQAKEKYLLAEKSNPNHLQVLTDIGTCYDKTGMPDSAIYYYKRALQLQSQFIEAIYNLSAVYFNFGKAGNAYTLLKTISAREKPTNKYGQYINAILAGIRDSVIAAEKVSDDSILRQDLDKYYLLHLDSLTNEKNNIQQLIQQSIVLNKKF